jgi:Cd2+/Zn2+-exporting ATPase
MVKKELVLEGEVCPNCAVKIENEVRRLGSVSSASLNVMKGTMELELVDDFDQGTVDATREIINRHEPHVKVHEEESSHEKPSEKDPLLKEKLTLGGALVIFAAGFLFEDTPAGLPLFLAAFLLSGYPVLYRAVRNILRGEVFDENFLMTIATVGAFAIGEYPEGAAVMIFYQIGELFQDIAVMSSRRSITSLLKIRPDYAVLLSEGTERRVDPKDCTPGDIIVIRPGEKVPLDSTIIEGSTSVDTRVMTGESMPRDLKPGDVLLSGFVNISGLVKARVDKNFGESSVSKILRIVQEASMNKARTEQFITKFARVYTPIVVGLAAALAVIPPLMTGDAFSVWLYRALIFLVISCPCALVISIPLGFFGGIGASSRNGILVKGGNFLEALNEVGTVVFDKTGTLTEGVFEVTDVVTEMDRHEFMGIAALAESSSPHPIAKSVVDAYNGQVDRSRIGEAKEIPGMGVSLTTTEGDVYLAGNSRLVSVDGEKDQIQGTRIHVSKNGSHIGTIILSDRLKSNAKETIAHLKKKGIASVMLTGDIRENAMAAASELGIDEVHYQLMPEDKLRILEEKLGKGKKLVFAGDGINDTPVLARADIGIAMGAMGSDAAIESADVVVMDDDPMKIATSMDIAAYTRTVVYQNIAFALGVKALVMLMGALGEATMWQAVFADVGVAFLAILNSMRIMRRDFRKAV